MASVARPEGDAMTQQAGDAAGERPAGEPAVELVQIEFRMPADHLDSHHVQLAGEFNGWSKTATPMRRSGAHFVATVSLVPGRTYRYKFLVDGERWENDWSADAYVPNEYGGDDSLIDLTTISTPERAADPDSPGAAVDDRHGEIPEPNEPA